MITIKGRFPNLRHFRISATKLAAFVGNATITGTLALGSTLTATATTVGLPKPSLSYVWTRNGTPIPGETGSTYVVSLADSGALIGVVVRATGLGSVTSSDSKTIPAFDPAWTSPVLARTVTTNVYARALSISDNGATAYSTNTQDVGGGRRGTQLTRINTLNGAFTPLLSLPDTPLYDDGIMQIAVTTTGLAGLVVRNSASTLLMTRDSVSVDWTYKLVGQCWEGNLSDDGKRAIVSQTNGLLYQYDYTGNSWVENQLALGSVHLGSSISGDGSWIIYYGYNTNNNRIKFYNLNTRAVSSLPVPYGAFRGKINRDGTIAAVLDTQGFTVSIYKRTGTTWATIQTVSLAPDIGYLGNHALSMTASGKTIAVAGGTNNSDNIGRMVVLQSSDLSTWSKKSVSAVPDANGGIAISNDTTTIAIGTTSGVKIYKSN